jgi:Uma2 family endonuclease
MTVMGALHEPPPLLRRHRITADEYQQLGRVQFFAPGTRVELIDGEVIDMAPIGTRHWATVIRLHELIATALGRRAIVSSQSSLRLGTHSEPQPDLGVFIRRADFYASALPTAADTMLLIEVADSTVRYDREIKLPLYARHGVPEFWIVDLDADILRMYREPEGEGYAKVVETSDPGMVTISALPDIQLDLGGLFGAK